MQKDAADTEDVAHIELPFCEPMYEDIYGTITLENDSVEGEVQMVSIGSFVERAGRPFHMGGVVFQPVSGA